MQLYPHWLDGEFVRIYSKATGPNQDVRDMIRSLKLHALLGTQFILNDVQIFDSAAVLALFNDGKAREFLRQDWISSEKRREPGFLGLRVDPDPRLGVSPLALAARGFARTCAEGWISSVFIADATPIKRLAAEIIEDVHEHGYIDTARPSDVIRNYPEYTSLLQAARHAVCHFSSCGAAEQLKAPPGKRTNYYQVLRESANKQDPNDEEADNAPAADALRFIDDEIEDPKARTARSRVRSILHRIDDPKRREHIWNNVVQAWNYAIQQTLLPDGGSVGTLPGALSPAQSFDSRIDVLVPVRSADLKGLGKSGAAPATLPCDIDDIAWDQIAQVRERTADTMGKLSLARRTCDMDLVSEPLRKHLEAVGAVLRPPQKVSPVIYLLTIGSAVAAVFGGDQPNVLAAAVIGAGAVHNAWRDTMPWRQRRALTNTLFRATKGQSK